MELPVLLGQLHLVAEVGAPHHPAGAAPPAVVLLVRFGGHLAVHPVARALTIEVGAQLLGRVALALDPGGLDPDVELDLHGVDVLDLEIGRETAASCEQEIGRASCREKTVTETEAV